MSLSRIVCQTAASRASLLSPAFLFIVFERHLLAMYAAAALYSLMSFNELRSTCMFCRNPGLRFQLSESQQGQQAISAFHIKVVIREFNSVFPVLAAYAAAKDESSAYKHFLGLRISDFCVDYLPISFLFPHLLTPLTKNNEVGLLPIVLHIGANVGKLRQLVSTILSARKSMKLKF